MKLSSSETLPVSGAVRPAKFDRPLRGGSTRSWGDTEVDRQVREAVARGREEGQAAGYAAGWAQGRQAAAEQAQAQAEAVTEELRQQRRADAVRLTSILESLGRRMNDLALAHRPAWAEVGDAVADGALQLARAALGRELASVDQVQVEAIRTALHHLGDPEIATVSLHPQDHQIVSEVLGASDDGLPSGVRLKADPSVRAGDVAIATPTQRLVHSLPQALAAAEEALRS